MPTKLVELLNINLAGTTSGTDRATSVPTDKRDFFAFARRFYSWRMRVICHFTDTTRTAQERYEGINEYLARDFPHYSYFDLDRTVLSSTPDRHLLSEVPYSGTLHFNIYGEMRQFPPSVRNLFNARRSAPVALEMAPTSAESVRPQVQERIKVLQSPEVAAALRKLVEGGNRSVKESHFVDKQTPHDTDAPTPDEPPSRINLVEQGIEQSRRERALEEDALHGRPIWMPPE
jgi:hypothetical protein